MKSKEKQWAFSALAHHAYCVEGAGPQSITAFTEKLREACDIPHKSPDCIALATPSFGIDEAREWRAWAATRPVGGSKKFFILATDAVTAEAQNALLKTCEEPVHGTHFFLLIPRALMLLPTLRSRMEVVSAEAVGLRDMRPVEGEDAPAFLAATPSARLARVQKIADALKKEKTTKGEIAAYIGTLVRASRGAGALSRERAASLEHLARAETFARDRGASLKMLLEHLAVVLPKR